MNEQQLKELVFTCIGKIAPEADLASLQPDVRFRDQFPFDSVDCMNLMNMFAKELDVTIPEVDYPQLSTLNGCIRYLLG